MSEPTPTEKILAEIRDDQRQHLQEYRRFIGEVRAQQAKARKGVWVLFILIVLIVALIVFLNGVGRCWLRPPAPPGPSFSSESPESPVHESEAYRFTPEQLGEIRTIESRFKGVSSITSLIDALGEPDGVIDQTLPGTPVFTRRFLFRGPRTIDVEVQQTYGEFRLYIRPKPAAVETQPARSTGRENG